MAKRPVSASPRRRRDAAATREAILAAATRRFAVQGYERAGVREIAADAGVTAALVNRYFGSKEGLFAEVIERALDMGNLLEGRRGDLADHLARLMVYGREDSPERVYTPLLLLLRSAAEPGAVKLFRRDLNRTELPLLAEQIGGDAAAVRAVMVMAQLTGFAIMYHVLRPKAFADARGEELVALLSRTLAACIG
ncbi:MAG TPA: TetR family transcriptional regulator [Isosphaeraceae bacterium]|nr:TetR family transcriptional regulator [Isosphaeraceae bacterium]